MTLSALVVGATRGIGRQIALTLADNGYKVGIAAKTVEETSKLPGTIYSVAEEISERGGTALPLICNVRKETDIESATERCIQEFGALDVLVYNAGAILWERVIDTPLKRFDLMFDVNVRGAYCAIQHALPHMLERKTGRILLVAPPIYSRFFKGKTPYSVSKVGMTILMHGLANELKDTGVSVSCLWPATTIKTHVTKVRNVPDFYLRQPTIFADAVYKIISEPSERYNGKVLLDEDLLRSLGQTDFTKYRCDPYQEPPRIMPREFPDLRVAEEDTVVLPDSKL